MAKQIKPKYPADWEKQSQAFINSQVTTSSYSTYPGVSINISGEYSQEIVSDLQNAIDEVLKHHSK
jgi:hypothetical protein